MKSVLDATEWMLARMPGDPMMGALPLVWEDAKEGICETILTLRREVQLQMRHLAGYAPVEMPEDFEKKNTRYAWVETAPARDMDYVPKWGTGWWDPPGGHRDARPRRVKNAPFETWEGWWDAVRGIQFPREHRSALFNAEKNIFPSLLDWGRQMARCERGDHPVVIEKDTGFRSGRYMSDTSWDSRGDSFDYFCGPGPRRVTEGSAETLCRWVVPAGCVGWWD